MSIFINVNVTEEAPLEGSKITSFFSIIPHEELHLMSPTEPALLNLRVSFKNLVKYSEIF